jgi:hypothetical protein
MRSDPGKSFHSVYVPRTQENSSVSPNGKVVAIADELDDIARQLRQAEPDPSKTFCIEAGIDYQQTQDIWMAP